VSVIVWVAEEVLDHEAGYIRGVFSSRELAVKSILCQNAAAEWRIFYEENGNVSVDSGHPFAATCVSISAHEIDVYAAKEP
jgi:hypothetical protein